MNVAPHAAVHAATPQEPGSDLRALLASTAQRTERKDQVSAKAPEITSASSPERASKASAAAGAARMVRQVDTQEVAARRIEAGLGRRLATKPGGSPIVSVQAFENRAELGWVVPQPGTGASQPDATGQAANMDVARSPEVAAAAGGAIASHTASPHSHAAPAASIRRAPAPVPADVESVAGVGVGATRTGSSGGTE